MSLLFITTLSINSKLIWFFLSSFCKQRTGNAALSIIGCSIMGEDSRFRGRKKIVT